MSTKRAELLSTLKAVAPALAAKNTIEQGISFVFKGGRVFTYNDSIAISHPVEVDIEGAVKAQEFMKILTKLKDEEIELATNGSELLITGKRATAGIRLEAEITLPINEIQEPEGWAPLPDNFVPAIQFACLSTGRDMTKPVLGSLHINRRIVESSDNFRITRYQLTSPFRGPLLLPAVAAAELVPFSPIEYVTALGWIHFRNKEGVMFSARTYEGQFPDMEPFLFVGDDCYEMETPADLPEILERAGIFSPSEYEHGEFVEIHLEGNRMTIRGEGPSGWFEERCPARWSGDQAVCFRIHPRFFKEIANHSKKVRVDTKLGRLRIDGENFVHAIVLSAPQ